MNATTAQRDLAEKAFANYDFGSDSIDGYDGWRDDGDGSLTRVFYLLAEEDEDDEEAESSREVFIVRFSADGSSVAEAFVRE